MIKIERHSSQAFVPAKTKNSCERGGERQREEREVHLKDKGGQTTTEALESKTLYQDAREGGMKWARRTEVRSVK